MIRSNLTGSKRLAAALVAAGTLALLAGAASASASTPSAWWHLSTFSRPTSIEPGQAKNEVMEVTVSKEAIIRFFTTKGYSTFFLTEPYYAMYGGAYPELNAKNIQKYLEEEVYGAGNVVVTGGPAGGKPFLIEGIGKDADIKMEKLIVAPAEGTAELHVATPGRADGSVVVVATNRGDGEADGFSEPITISDKLPPGLKAVTIQPGRYGFVYGKGPGGAGTSECSLETTSCTFGAGGTPPYSVVEVEIPVIVQPGASAAETNEAKISGGHTPPASSSGPISIGAGSPRYEVMSYEMSAEEEGGAPDRQAGSHPFQLTTSLMMSQTFDARPIALDKDLHFNLPAGLIGNPGATPTCPLATFLNEHIGQVSKELAAPCAQNTIVGVAVAWVNEPGFSAGLARFTAPLYNLEPSPGEPARFGFTVTNTPVELDTSVRTGGDYGVTVSTDNIPQTAGFLGSEVTFWGVPGSSRHNNARGEECLQALRGNTAVTCEQLTEVKPPPLMSMPTSCLGALQSTVEADSWKEPHNPLPPKELDAPMPGLMGCNQLPFHPSIGVAPDVEEASTPSGLTVNVHVSQAEALNAEGLAPSTLRNTTVVLPQGVTLNPGGADGLEACTESEIGFKEKDPADPALNLFTPGLPNPFCPDGAKIGTVKITTPLLPNPLQGAVYLASPAPNGEAGQNPFNTLLSMDIVAEDPVSGTLVKLPGKVVPDLRTGQLTATFQDTPQLPFEDLTLHFFGGARAPLSTPSTPASCPQGYVTHASFAPWSGNPSSAASSEFDIRSGPHGAPCGPRPFAPEFAAGMLNLQAGGFSELRTTMGHPDADQQLGGLQVRMPPGVMGTLASVKLCEEPQAAQGTCDASSLIGHTVVTVGLGNNPAVVKRPGDVYITGPYKGAPYGLSIVNPAQAGPFDLGRIVVRSKIEVDPHTAQLTIVSDPLPSMLDGIPLDIQHVTVQIDRQRFTFNPTSCAKMKIEGAMSSAEGALAPVSMPFQVANCANLAFKPKFSASTSAKTSRQNGASLHVRLAYPNAAFDEQANMKSVHVELPKALPSRLSTLNQACTDSVFNENPASCPAASRVGYAKAVTPILPVPLEGPAYFVSNGGQKFPELIVVLQGYGVTIELAGGTFISKAGITSSTFNTVPDVPVGSFELTLPEGSFSALAADRDLCAARLTMPTRLEAQNGASLSQSTPIRVTGCKPTLRVVRHNVKGATATVVVRVPSAGRLVGEGPGLSSKAVHARTAGVERLSLRLFRKKQRFLARHPGRKLKVTAKLRFTPARGRSVSASVTLIMG